MITVLVLHHLRAVFFILFIKTVYTTFGWSQCREPQNLTSRPGQDGHAAPQHEVSPLKTNKFYFIAVASVNLFSADLYCKAFSFRSLLVVSRDLILSSVLMLYLLWSESCVFSFSSNVSIFFSRISLSSQILL